LHHESGKAVRQKKGGFAGLFGQSAKLAARRPGLPAIGDEKPLFCRPYFRIALI